MQSGHARVPIVVEGLYDWYTGGFRDPHCPRTDEGVNVVQVDDVRLNVGHEAPEPLHPAWRNDGSERRVG
jgi:hypothetical protein